MRFLELDRACHEDLAALTEKATLIEAEARALDLIILSGLNALTRPGRAGEVVREHTAILEAIRDQQVEMAQAAIGQHVSIGAGLRSV